MTYSHALRYLTTPDAPQQISLPLPLTVKWSHTPVLVCFTRNKLGSAAAGMLAGVLKQAGISYLHWIDDDTADAKSRFLMDGRPISPPLLSRHAAQWQAAARAEGRDLSPAERCAGVLSACAAETDCRVILLEAPLSVCHVGLFASLNKRMRAITLLSDGQVVPRTASNSATSEIITPAYGMTMHSRITDICAKNDCKMVPIAASAVQRTDVALGGQTLLQKSKNGSELYYRLSSGSRVAADAATLALYAIHSLGARGLAISEDTIRHGLLYAVPPHCGTVYSMQPLILTHAVTDEQELSLILPDITDLVSTTAAPICVWPEPALIPLLPKAIPLYLEQDWPAISAPSLLLVGSYAWIESKLSARKSKKSKNIDKI